MSVHPYRNFKRWLSSRLARLARRPGLTPAELLALPAGWLDLQVSPYKGLSQMLRITGTQVVTERSSPLGLISVVESDTIPFRHAPGLSLHAATIPDQLGLFTDAGGMTVVNHNPQGQALDYLDQLTSALPYHLASPQRVLELRTVLELMDKV